MSDPDPNDDQNRRKRRRHHIPSASIVFVFCSICQYEGDPGLFSRLSPCLHSFHTTCVVDWLLGDSSCPSCRQAVLLRDEVPVPFVRQRVAESYLEDFDVDGEPVDGEPLVPGGPALPLPPPVPPVP